MALSFVSVPAAQTVAPTPVLRGAFSEPRVETGASSGFSTAACSLVAAAGVVGVAANRRRNSAKVTREAVGIAINGFGRIGRQVARIAMKDPEVELKLVNASYDAEYLAYQMILQACATARRPPCGPRERMLGSRQDRKLQAPWPRLAAQFKPLGPQSRRPE